MPRLPMRPDATRLAALLARRGWVALPHDPKIAAWAAAAHAAACVVTADPAQQQRWLHHGATWFVGVDALPNGPDGGIGGVALAGDWRGLVRMPGQLHPAQVSVIHPGYPGRDPADTDAAHRFRRDRDAAHLDGLLAEGADKRRHLREPHAFVLGLALTATSAGASPLVVWEASPAIIRAAFVAVYAGSSPDRLTRSSSCMSFSFMHLVRCCCATRSILNNSMFRQSLEAENCVFSFWASIFSQNEADISQRGTRAPSPRPPARCRRERQPRWPGRGRRIAVVFGGARREASVHDAEELRVVGHSDEIERAR